MAMAMAKATPESAMAAKCQAMMADQNRMMTHMVDHMQAGKDSMAMCPMMKQMKHMEGMKH